MSAKQEKQEAIGWLRHLRSELSSGTDIVDFILDHANSPTPNVTVREFFNRFNRIKKLGSLKNALLSINIQLDEAARGEGKSKYPHLKCHGNELEGWVAVVPLPCASPIELGLTDLTESLKAIQLQPFGELLGVQLIDLAISYAEFPTAQTGYGRYHDAVIAELARAEAVIALCGKKGFPHLETEDEPRKQQAPLLKYLESFYAFARRRGGTRDHLRVCRAFVEPHDDIVRDIVIPDHNLHRNSGVLALTVAPANAVGLYHTFHGLRAAIENKWGYLVFLRKDKTSTVIAHDGTVNTKFRLFSGPSTLLTFFALPIFALYRCSAEYRLEQGAIDEMLKMACDYLGVDPSSLTLEDPVI